MTARDGLVLAVVVVIGYWLYEGFIKPALGPAIAVGEAAVNTVVNPISPYPSQQTVVNEVTSGQAQLAGEQTALAEIPSILNVAAGAGLQFGQSLVNDLSNLKI